MLCDDVICFRPAKISHSSLYWDCNYSSNAMRVKNQFKENLKMSKIVKEAIKRTGLTQTMNKMDTKTRPKSPEKTWSGGQFAVFTKNLEFSLLQTK